MTRLLAILALTLAGAAGAAHAADSTKVADVRIARRTAAIALDGALDDAAWQSAPVTTGFLQRDPNEGAPATQNTEVRLLYDDQALYVAARLHDTSPDSIVKYLTRRDERSRSDYFQIFLDPYYDRRSGFYFGVNAAGTLFDGTLYNDGWNSDAWDGVWEGRSRVDDGGWTVEMRIPFTQLRFARAEVQRWGINFYRSLGRGFEDDYLVYQPKKESGFVSRFPTLVGLENVTPGQAIEIVPFVTSKSEYLRESALGAFNDGSRTVANAGGDLRMALTNQLTLNATVNPDFGQVEVDPAVVNLSDVETFFPEKRPFFVEGSSIFEAGQQGASDYWGFNWQQPTFFYSRRIGRAPQGSLPGDWWERDVPNGTTILGAAKVSGKLGTGGNFGMLHALTAREHADLISASRPFEHQLEVEPMTYYGVGRYLKEFPERRHGLGFISTVAARSFDDPRLEHEFNESSLLGAVDGWHYLDGRKTWILSGWAGGSHVTGTEARITSLQTSPRRYYQRPDAKSFELDPTATSLSGAGARLWLNKERGPWMSNSAIGFLTPGLEVNDLGFLNRSDLINGHVGLGYNWTTPTKHVRHHHALAALYAGSNFDGDLTDAGVYLKKFWWWNNNWVTELRGGYNPETVDPRRSRGGPRMLEAEEWTGGFFWDTDGGRVRYYYAGGDVSVSPDEDSWSWSFEPGITYKPMSNLSIQVGPSFSRLRDGAFYFTTLTDPAATATYGQRYLFARLEQTTLAANIRLNVSFSPTMSLQFFGQPLISTGEYRNFRELARPKSLDFLDQGDPGAGSWTFDPAGLVFDPDGAGPDEAYDQADFNFKSLRGNAVFRWEYLPGSTFFLVWTQERTDVESLGDFDVGPNFRQLVRADADNIFLAKVTYYLSR
jgi:hypothetical protein